MRLASTATVPITWGGSDCFTHMLVVGPTRCGKTATILKPIIYQLLLQKKRGIPLGLSVVEPKGDVAAMVAEMSEEMGLPYIHIDPMKPDTDRFNPMEGEINDVAEATVVVLKGLFGKQDAFFATVQELSARNVTKLLKELHGDHMDIIDVMNTLRDQAVLEAKVAELKQRDGMTDLVHFFESELLGSMRDKYRQFIIGLRAQLENVVSNDALRRIMTGKSSISIDEHFENGGILAVNTALGMLRSSGDAFGQFVTMHLQNGTFRRPGTESSRVPHYLIVDEYSRYINPDVEIFLSLAAEYRVAGIFATQSLGQLELESGKVSAKAMKRSILANCRNKIAFGGVGAEDAKEFAEMFGKDKIIMRQSTYKNRIFLPNLFPDSYRDTENEEYRFDPTDLIDGLPRFNFVHQLMQGGALQKPALGQGKFIPRDWKERKEWESGSLVKRSSMDMKRVLNLLLRRWKGKGRELVISGYIEAPKKEIKVPSMHAVPEELAAPFDTQGQEPNLTTLYERKEEKSGQRVDQPPANRKLPSAKPEPEKKAENRLLVTNKLRIDSKRGGGVLPKHKQDATIISPKTEEETPNIVLCSDDGFWD
ncbi:type IV secretory system conjugative DNA transfer family protein [Bacillus rubiinfantis]|nr:type IV secretory system conjugative DNA transfer family protein [Bacillus rubiinfantis]